MAKELDPSLFGEGSWSVSRTVEKPKVSVEHLENKIVDLRLQVRDIKEELRRWSVETDEFRQATQGRFEQLAQRLSRVEDVQNKVSDEVVLKVSQLHHRLGDRQIYDKKVQDLIDRHNSVLRSAEMRLAQLQKVVEEKEAQIISAQVALNEAKMELAKLKRL